MNKADRQLCRAALARSPLTVCAIGFRPSGEPWDSVVFRQGSPGTGLGSRGLEGSGALSFNARPAAYVPGPERTCKGGRM